MLDEAEAEAIPAEAFTGLGRTDGTVATADALLVTPTPAEEGREIGEAEELARAESAGFGRTDTGGAAEALGAPVPVPDASMVVGGTEGMTGAAVAPAVTVSVLVTTGTTPSANAMDVGSAGREPPALADEGVVHPVAVTEAAVGAPVTTTSAVGNPSAPITVEAALAGELGTAAGTEEPEAGRVALERLALVIIMEGAESAAEAEVRAIVLGTLDTPLTWTGESAESGEMLLAVWRR